MLRAEDVHQHARALMLQARRYWEERSLRLAVQSWAGESHLQAQGRRFLIQTLLRQLMAVWAAWCEMVQVGAAYPHQGQCTPETLGRLRMAGLKHVHDH